MVQQGIWVQKGFTMVHQVMSSTVYFVEDEYKDILDDIQNKSQSLMSQSYLL
jgi:hypothetical protein